jgi:hypothetical protein
MLENEFWGWRLKYSGMLVSYQLVYHVEGNTGNYLPVDMV